MFNKLSVQSFYSIIKKDLFYNLQLHHYTPKLLHVDRVETKLLLYKYVYKYKTFAILIPY